jgi:hypothetical protein
LKATLGITPHFRQIDRKSFESKPESALIKRPSVLIFASPKVEKSSSDDFSIAYKSL